jgi:hypothetical protein
VSLIVRDFCFRATVLWIPLIDPVSTAFYLRFRVLWLQECYSPSFSIHFPHSDGFESLSHPQPSFTRFSDYFL